MSLLCIVLALMTIAFAAGCIALRRKNKAFEGMLCKFMASFGFISVAVVGYSLNPVDTYYFCLVCFALMFGFCGDVLLGIKEIAPTFRGKLVPLGLLYFLVGHIFYLCAFIRSSSFSFVAFAVGAVFQTDGLDAGGGKTNSLWIIWTVIFVCFTLGAFLIDLFAAIKRK